MADNIDVDPGTTGAKQPVATDDCGISGHFQRIKLDIGGDGVSSPVTSTNGVPVALPTATDGGDANVTASASNVTLLAANAARRGASIMNDSTAILYVKFGATASTTSFHVKMAAGSYLEVPFGYTGIIDGIWASATGDARVGEFT